MLNTPKKLVNLNELIRSNNDNGNINTAKKIDMAKTRTCRLDSSSHGVPGLIPAIHGPSPVFSKTGSRISPTAIKYATPVPKQKTIMCMIKSILIMIL